MKKNIAIGLIVLCVVFVAAGCKEEVPPSKPKPVNVTVEVIKPVERLADTFILPGVVEPNRVVKVCAEVSARIEQVYGKEGVVCKKGDRLVRLNDELLKARYDQASSKLAFSGREFRRTEKLHKRNVATNMELDIARTTLAASQADFNAAKANMERVVIMAPIGGILNRIPVEQGEYVSPGVCIAQIVDMDIARVVLDVPERDVGYLKKGRTGRIFIAAGEKKELTGRIDYISELAHAQSLTTRVELVVPNALGTGQNGGRALRSGRIVRVRLLRRLLENAIMVKLSAIIPLEKGYAVYVVEKSRAVRKFVQVGFIQGSRIRITEGLQAGDRLIVAGHQYVGPGQKVAVRNPTTRKSKKSKTK